MNPRWRDPRKELPKAGEIVAVIYAHWKEHMPLSYQIMFGEVTGGESGQLRAESFDMTGSGAWSVAFDKGRYGDEAVAWAPWGELNLPDWLPHDTHWGKRGAAFLAVKP